MGVYLRDRWSAVLVLRSMARTAMGYICFVHALRLCVGKWHLEALVGPYLESTVHRGRAKEWLLELREAGHVTGQECHVQVLAQTPKGVAWGGARAEVVSPDGRRVEPHRYERDLSTVSGERHAPEGVIPEEWPALHMGCHCGRGVSPSRASRSYD